MSSVAQMNKLDLQTTRQNSLFLVSVMAAGLRAFSFCSIRRISCIPDEEDDEGDEKTSRAPQPMSSSALIKLAEGDEDVVEDLELSDDD